MTSLARGVFEDLKRRRLLPVAGLLLVALVAIPVLLLKSAEPVAPAPTTATAITAAAPDGLPSPNQVLGNEKPLVTLAVLDEPSNLGEFDSRNPFKPIDQVSEDGAGSGSGAAGDQVVAADDGAAAGGGGGGGGGEGNSDSTESPSPGSGNPPADTPTSPRENNPTTPEPETEKKLTYALDLTIRGPKGLRSYRNLPKLSLLPAQDNPLLVFLGVEDAGTKAVFLVDAKLRSKEGEGTCTPAPEQCATLALAPGEEHVLVNDQAQTWTIRIVEVRETSVAKAAASARKAQRRRARQATTSVGDRQIPRFVPPMITDLFTGGRS